MKTNKTVQTVMLIICTIAVLFSYSAVAMAAPDEPIKAVNNLRDFIYALLQAIGVIMLIWGGVQIALSLKSHDPSQRSNALLFIGGALIVLFIQPIVTFIQS